MRGYDPARYTPGLVGPPREHGGHDMRKVSNQGQADHESGCENPEATFHSARMQEEWSYRVYLIVDLLHFRA